MTDTNENPREQRGHEIAKKYDQIRRMDENHYEVQSQSQKYKWYSVTATVGIPHKI